ncbi:hypothetical protein [Brevibacterium picturae]|uniref:Phage integrase family protein n=1 Tax=Brevibacterium picturae TaxID=260553 RepID=A0ABP4MK36_9MICO
MDDEWKRTIRRASSEAEARVLFSAVEAALDTEQSIPAGAPEKTRRTIAALAQEYITDSEQRGRTVRTIQGRESRINAHILPAIGDVIVSKWRIEDSRRVMEKGSQTIHSMRGREDLRGVLAAMRKLAWRLGWLDRSIDPLDGLEIGKSTVLHGATTHYVDPRRRPETRQVLAMAAAADTLCGADGTEPLLTRLPLFGTKIRVAGFGGLRLGEQNALRAIDVFFDRGYIQVNGSWTTPRHSVGFRGPVKNHVLHEVPLPKSLMHGEILPRVKRLLGFDANTSLQRVINALEDERQRRADLATAEASARLAWWNYPVDPHDEQWLFVDTATGLPVKPEMHNARWHVIRQWVDEHDPDNAWPKTIVYRNLRHHAATKWFHDELGESWEVVAQYLGDKLTTVLNHYVRAGEDALRESVNRLESM